VFEGYEHYDYQCPSKSRHVSIVSNDVDSKVVEGVHDPFKATSIIKDISVGSDTPILDEGHASYEDTSAVVNAIVESGTPLIEDAHIHDTSDLVPELVESNVSDHISRYLFATSLIENEIVDSKVVTSSRPSESPRADYDFMVIPIESFSSESS